MALLCLHLQIQAIREESEKFKGRVYDYQTRLTNQVEVYNSELMAKKEQLEETRTKLYRFMRDSHVIDQVKQKQEMTEELVRHRDVELQNELPSKPVLIAKGKPLT